MVGPRLRLLLRLRASLLPAQWNPPPSRFATHAELEGYLAIERRRPPCGDPQHIWNKLLFDAANEVLAAHYGQARGSSGAMHVHVQQSRAAAQQKAGHGGLGNSL